jgi:hypothetical protein
MIRALTASRKHAFAGLLLVCLALVTLSGLDFPALASSDTLAVPVAAFSGTPTIGVAPLQVQFTDESTGDPTSWSWYFGDEDLSGLWTQMTANAEWTPRSVHTSVALPDGSIVLMGGDDGSFSNEVWRSIDKGATWVQMTAAAEWAARSSHTSVALPDGSIVLMGGIDSAYYCLNDVWRSTDKGGTWTQMTAAAEWTARKSYSSVALSDGSIVLMGGINGADKNDVWRSTDQGATWTQMAASAEWTPRHYHTSVVLPDDSVVLMGGYFGTSPDPSAYKNDVWRSTDRGATWTQMTASAGWSERFGHTSVALLDGSVVLMGGSSGPSNNDVWRSTDQGATWTQVTAGAEWTPRTWATSVALPDGSIVLMGGFDSSLVHKNDVWRLQPAGSTVQNPSHTYTKPGTYQVALWVCNADGCSSERKVGYITVTGANYVYLPLVLRNTP